MEEIKEAQRALKEDFEEVAEICKTNGEGLDSACSAYWDWDHAKQVYTRIVLALCGGGSGIGGDGKFSRKFRCGLLHKPKSTRDFAT